jgi:SAM-dependent methyltransferase
LPHDSTRHLYERYYFARSDFVDGTSAFHALCRQKIEPQSHILEIGAGPSNGTSDFLAGFGQLDGVDVSDEVLTNRALNSAVTYEGHTLPYPDACFDACVSNYVLEHVTNPKRHFYEVARVLRPGGVYVFRTPNLYYYVSLASAALPHRVHKAIANRLRAMDENSHEPWPTAYRANTIKRLHTLAAYASMSVEFYRIIEPEPSYARASAFLFYPMMLWERLLNATPLLEGLRANILAVMRKAPGSTSLGDGREP